jgi:clan AA aspartic protease (TIGR02281 family)
MKRFLIPLLIILIASPLCAATEIDYLLQGRTYLAEKAYDEAVRAFKQAIRVDPKSADAYRGLGRAYFNLGNSQTASIPQMLDEAVTAYKEALAISPDADTLYDLGVAYLMSGDAMAAQEIKGKLYSENRDQGNLLAMQIGAERDRAAYDKQRSDKRGGLLQLSGRQQSSHEQYDNQTSVKVGKNQILVPVTFDHRGTSIETWLILDTGATNTTITSTLARQLGIEAKDITRGMAVIADGSVVRTAIFRVDNVTVGPKAVRDLKVGVVISRNEGMGLLGMDFLGNFLYTVDPRRGIIHWQE